MTHSCQDWIQQFQEDFLQRGRSETSWKTDYWKILNRLPLDAPLSPALLHDLVLSTPVNTKTRKRACMVTKAIAKFAGVEYDPAPYAGKYSPRAVNPRRIPSDELISAWHGQMKNPGWRWVFGVIATYGLRPHEAFRLETNSLQAGRAILRILPNTKTGSRSVWAFHPEWFEQFDLANVQLPPITLDKPNVRIGESASHYFRGINLPFCLYDLRHRWAIRTLEYGLDTGLAARQMGHSKEVHDTIYHRWIEDAIQQRAYDALLNRPDRPKPPN